MIDTVVRKAEFLVVTDGSYSDTDVIGLFFAKCDFDVQELMHDIGIKVTDEETTSSSDAKRLLRHCIERGFLEVVRSREFHLGSAFSAPYLCDFADEIYRTSD